MTQPLTPAQATNARLNQQLTRWRNTTQSTVTTRGRLR